MVTTRGVFVTLSGGVDARTTNWKAFDTTLPTPGGLGKPGYSYTSVSVTSDPADVEHRTKALQIHTCVLSY